MRTSKNKKIKKGGRLRVIQITGLRGILSVCFVGLCLTAGFVGFPSIVLYKFWNYIAGYVPRMPVINIIQGLLLWGILATLYLIINEKKRGLGYIINKFIFCFCCIIIRKNIIISSILKLLFNCEIIFPLLNNIKEG